MKIPTTHYCERCELELTEGQAGRHFHPTEKLKTPEDDTSASANASPVEHKHEHPPTPTIEEQLDEILSKFDPFDNSHNDYLRRKPHAIAALTLLITKARENELESIPLENRGDGGIWLTMSLDERNKRIAELRGHK